MGTGSSVQRNYANLTKEKYHIDNRHDIFNKIEKFIYEVYYTYPSSESLKMILSNYLAYSAFENFANSLENQTSDFKLYQSIANILALSKDGIQLSQSQFREVYELILASEIVNKVKIANQLSNYYKYLITSPMSAIHNYRETVDSTKRSMNEILRSLQQDTLETLSNKYLKDFLSSKYYRNWRTTEYAHAIAQTAEDHSVHSSSVTIRQLKIYSSISSISTNNIKRNFSNPAFENIEKNQAVIILGKNNWLSALVSGVEGLPIGFSISTVNIEINEYPIFFINSYYEKMFGINKNNILNKHSPLWSLPLQENNKTIQFYIESSKEYTSMLSYPDNEDRHLYIVSIKPIYDHNKNYVNLICLYIDLGSANYFDLKKDKDISFLFSQQELVKGLINILPNMLLHNEVELD